MKGFTLIGRDVIITFPKHSAFSSFVTSDSSRFSISAICVLSVFSVYANPLTFSYSR